jgi:hypothetical protein
MHGQVHLPHSALSDEALDLVIADARPDHTYRSIIVIDFAMCNT